MATAAALDDVKSSQEQGTQPVASSRAVREKPLSKLLRLVVARADQLCVLLTLVGLLGVLALPLLDRPAKFDEKALLVGGVSPTFTAASIVPAMRLARAANEHHHQRQPKGSLADLLAEHMRSVGLQVAQTPVCFGGGAAGGNTSAPGRGARAPWSAPAVQPGCVHVHGVLRAPQTDGSESLLLVTPVALTRTALAGEGGGQASVSPYWDAPAQGSLLLLAGAQALLHHLATVPWLSRDVVWVVPDARCGATASLRHWAALHLGGDGAVREGAAPVAASRAPLGVPQQALVLQADRAPVNSASVLLGGFDGQLPKLDTYLVLLRLLPWIQGTGVPELPASTAVSAALAWLRARGLLGRGPVPPEMQRHADKLSVVLEFIRAQAMGLPSGPHAALKEHMVDAATTRLTARDWHTGRVLPPPADPELDRPPAELPPGLQHQVQGLAQYSELVLRSLNNLDERFHHSFFLYVLTALDRFITVEVYVVPLVALIAVLVLKASKQRQALRGAPVTASSSSASLWPCVMVLGLNLVAACLLAGASLRTALCRQCLLCQAHVSAGTECCASDVGGRGCMDGVAGWAVRWLPLEMQEHVAMLGAGRLVLLMASALAAALTLGWEVAGLLTRGGAVEWGQRGPAAPAVAPTASDMQPEGPQGGEAAPALAMPVDIAAQGPPAWQARLAGTRVVVLCTSAVLLTGMANVNWALAYTVAALLSLPVAASAVRPLWVKCGDGPAGARWHMHRAADPGLLVQGAALAATSPFMVAWLAMCAMPTQDDSWAAGTPWSPLTGWQMTLCCSWPTAYVFLWATYLPCWICEVLCLAAVALAVGPESFPCRAPP